MTENWREVILFQVESVLEKRIRLTQTQWPHIQTSHHELENQHERIQETLQFPDFVYYDEGEDTYKYYKFFTATPVTQKHLLVVAKYLNNEGFVITAFYLRRVRERGILI